MKEEKKEIEQQLREEIKHLKREQRFLLVFVVATLVIQLYNAIA